MLNFDATSDAIRHFIGMFELAELRSRLRLDYDELAARHADVDAGKITALDLKVPHPYIPGDYQPQVRYAPPDTDPGTVDNGAAMQYLKVPLLNVWQDLPQASIFGRSAPASGDITGALHHPAVPTIEFHLPPPPSTAVTIIQHNWLEDSDRLNADDMPHAVSQDVLILHLDALSQAATALGVSPDVALPASETDFQTMAHRLQDAVGEAETVGPGHGYSVFAADAVGSHLNGVAGLDRPDIQDIQPAHWKDLAARKDLDGDGVGDGPAHEIIHGANMLVNEVTLNVSWISAPVMAVGGDSCTIDLISQVNVWQDNDSVVGLAAGAWGGMADMTHAFNFASLDYVPRPIPAAASDDAAPPAFWAVTTIEGSLINFNWVEQRNFISDGDVTSITLQGMETRLIFGGNDATNMVSLFELGSQFDLIIVDGNLINLSAILQTNVLLDSDHVTMGAGGALSCGDNLLVNDASIMRSGLGQHVQAQGGYQQLLANGLDDLPDDVLNDPAFAGCDVLRVLEIKGDLISAQIIEQLNILGDADQIDLLAARAMANAGDVSVVTGSNVLINSARIAEFGVDSTVHTRGGIYSDALIHQAELVDRGNPYGSSHPSGHGGLASEAVVFLSDDMRGGAGRSGGSDDHHHSGPHSAIDGVPADPMQTVLA